jgi:activator of 2-hydroxyglutaryl-CoA dehydratase
VFAESEIVSLSAQGYPKADIIAGLHEAIGRRLQAMVKGVGVRPRVMMSGGVAKNQGVVRVLERLLAADIVVPEEPQIVGALGAVLYALEEVKSPTV